MNEQSNNYRDQIANVSEIINNEVIRMINRLDKIIPIKFMVTTETILMTAIDHASAKERILMPRVINKIITEQEFQDILRAHVFQTANIIYSLNTGIDESIINRSKDDNFIKFAVKASLYFDETMVLVEEWNKLNNG